MKITIPKPCHENWNDMTPDEKGRFCAVCSKTVRDFTDCSYEEIYEDLITNSNICGRFNDNQLNVNLRFLALKSFALGLLISGSTISAQKLTSEELDKLDFRRGIYSVSTINKNVNRAVFLGMPSAELIENSQPLIYLDGDKISEEKMTSLKKSAVDMVEILHGAEAEDKYGKRGRDYGVILITTKKKPTKEIN